MTSPYTVSDGPSGDRIIFVTIAWLLMTILYINFAVRQWTLYRTKIKYKCSSLRGIGGGCIWAVVVLATAYAALATWFALWSDPINLVEAGGVISPGEKRIPKGWFLNVKTVMKAQMALNLLYVTILWLVKGVFLLLCFEIWHKLSKDCKIAWSVTTGSVISSWIAILLVVLVKGLMCLDHPEGKSEREHFTKGHSFFTKRLVLLVGLSNIVTSLLLIALGLLTLRALRQIITHKETRSSASLFALATIGIFLEACRTATSHYPHGRRSWTDTLAICEIIIWAHAACLPSIILATSDSDSEIPRRRPTYYSGSSTSSRSDSSSRSPSSRNRKNLTVKTDPSIRSDLGYVIAQGDNGEKVQSAPLFAEPEKPPAVVYAGEKRGSHALKGSRTPRTPKTPRTPGGGGRTPGSTRRWDEKKGGKTRTGIEGSDNDASSSEEEHGSALRSGFEEGRDWRRNMNDVLRPQSAKAGKFPKV